MVSISDNFAFGYSVIWGWVTAPNGFVNVNEDIRLIDDFPAPWSISLPDTGRESDLLANELFNDILERDDAQSTMVVSREL